MMKKKSLILILVFSALIIFNLSLNTIYMAGNFGQDDFLLQGIELSHNDYISMVLINYALNLSVPMIFALYSIYEYRKRELSSIYIFIWLVLNIGGMAYCFYGMQILKVVTIVFYICNLAVLLYLSMTKQ